MSSKEWDEIKRLAADFQKAQLSTTIQKLSERNCVEIITKLLESKLLHVIFTVDGKEYVTPDQLVREIRDELYVHGGRINLVELAKILNIDLSHVAEKSAEIQRTDSDCTIILGQLIDKTYLKYIALEINERLSQHGQISIGDLTRHYDLPGDFLQSVVEKQLGKLIHGKQDKTNPRLFFTEAFVSRNRACIRGALAAVTKPITITSLLAQCGIPDRLFFSLIDSLIEAKEVHGVVTGKQSGNGMYVPTIYSKSQNDWVNNFYRQNGYLEYDALTRLGISDAHLFVRKHFPNEKLMQLSSCAVGPQIFDQVEAAVEEAMATSTFVDIMPILPSVFEPEDAEEILREILKQNGNKNPNYNTHIFCGTIAVTDHFIQRLTKLFDEVIKEKSQNVVISGVYAQFQADCKLLSNKSNADEEASSKGDKREERRKKATGGKGGGGTQGRETKTKSTKKKYQRGKNAGGDSDSDTPQSTGKTSKQTSKKFELLTLQDVKEVIEEEDLLQEDDLVELVTEIANYLYPALNKTALAATEAVYEASMASSSQLRRKTHSDLQDKLNMLIVNVRQFEKGLKNFPNKETQQQLSKYLLKTICTEIANDIFGFVAQENMIQYDHTKEFSGESRMKIVSDLRGDSKDALLRMHKSLTSDFVDDFLDSCEPALGTGVCDMVLRKQDKKKEKNVVFCHRAALMEQLYASEDDPSLVLHLAVVVLFQTITQTMLHVSGRFVLQVLNFIRPSLSLEAYKTLHDFHDMVMKLLAAEAKAEGEGNEEQEEIKKSLLEEIPKVKSLVSLFKKASATEKQLTE